MASGVTVAEEVVKVFNEMKVRKAPVKGEEPVKQKKIVFFRISDNLKDIIIDQERVVLVEDIGVTVDDPYLKLINLLPLKDCRYVLYDACFETNETKKEDLVFIYWAPEEAGLKSKLIYSSSKEALKKKFQGIKHEWQLNCFGDCKDRSCLAERLGTHIKTLEGKPVDFGGSCMMHQSKQM
ncbi:cofilin-2 [Latimeria chalumnae]|uniref:ADF-H domain-containing protein n=1 Tax=Latimeria chalumnae TaxID=7897 RepID=H3AWV9_LATCH|nr:PREDICTED: cofilin-2-like [Latimeria chalumnae]|eukprot:XP_005998155.1 PREDICTED: cofilin-2-like [Latimeria chalumnae]